MRRLRILALVAIGLALIAVPAAWALKVKKDPPPPTGYVGVAYYHDFEPDGGINPYSWSITSGGLPPGLTISSDAGIVSGTPTQVGQFSFYVQVMSGSGAVSQVQFTITIEVKFTVTTASPLPDAAINTPYTPVQLTASGGAVSNWKIQSGTLPPGIELSSSGVISGTPTAIGAYEFFVLADGGNGKTDNKKLRLTVNGPLVLGGPNGEAVKSEPVGRTYKVGATVAWGVKATGGTAPYTYGSTPLPPGITLAADGKVTGTALQAGVTPVTFTVTDSKGGIDKLTARFRIKAPLAFAPNAVAPPGRVDTPYEWTVPVKGASKTKLFLASGAFPPGLALDETTGTLTGTPLRAGVYRIKIWVFGDPGTQISKTFSIRIRP